MNDTTKKIMIALVVTLLLILLFKNKIKELMNKGKLSNAAMPTPTGATLVNMATGLAVKAHSQDSATVSDFPLKQGSRNSYVKSLQILLQVDSDGIFGAKTKSALQSQFNKDTVKSKEELQQMIDSKKNLLKSNEASLQAKYGASNLLTFFKSNGIL